MQICSQNSQFVRSQEAKQPKKKKITNWKSCKVPLGTLKKKKKERKESKATLEEHNFT